MGRRSEVPGGEDVKPEGKKREIPASETEDWCSLEELREWEQAKEEKNRELE